MSERRPSRPRPLDDTARVLLGRTGGQRSRSRRTPDEVLRARRPLYQVAVVLVVLALVLRQPLLVVAGLLVAVLTAVPEIWYRFGARGLEVRRQPVVHQAMLGDEVEVALTVENRQPLPLPWLQIEDEYPEALPLQGGTAARKTASERMVVASRFGVWAYQRVRRRVRVRCEARGAWRFGPIQLSITDPFGMLTLEKRLPAVSTLVVYPLVAPLERFGLAAQSLFGERKSPRRLLEDPLRVAGVRPYMPGDEPRRIHWKATAREGELRSKVYEPATRHTLAIFVDVRTYQRTLYGYDPLLAELAIAAGASVAHWGLEQGYAVGLFANGTMAAPELEEVPDEVAPAATAAGGEEPTAVGDPRSQYLARLTGAMRLRVPPSSNPAQLARVLDGLARLLPYGGAPMEQVVAGEQGRLPLGASVVYIGAEAAVDVPLIVALRRARATSHPVVLLLTGAPPQTAPDAGGNAQPSPALHLAGLTAHRIGDRDTWTALVGEVLGHNATGDAHAYPASEPPAGGRGNDGVRYARAARALVVE